MIKERGEGVVKEGEIFNTKNAFSQYEKAFLVLKILRGY